jgi:hypothetical protein
MIGFIDAFFEIAKITCSSAKKGILSSVLFIRNVSSSSLCHLLITTSVYSYKLNKMGDNGHPCLTPCFIDFVSPHICLLFQLLFLFHDTFFVLLLPRVAGGLFPLWHPKVYVKIHMYISRTYCNPVVMVCCVALYVLSHARFLGVEKVELCYFDVILVR